MARAAVARGGDRYRARRGPLEIEIEIENAASFASSATISSCISPCISAGEMPASVLPEGAEFEAMVEATARQLLGAITSMANWWDEHREVPRDQVMAMVMEFAWVGLERASAGERWNPGRG